MYSRKEWGTGFTASVVRSALEKLVSATELSFIWCGETRPIACLRISASILFRVKRNLFPQYEEGLVIGLIRATLKEDSIKRRTC